MQDELAHGSQSILGRQVLLSANEDMLNALKSRVGARVEAIADEIIALSLKIHDAKELGLEEFKSAGYLAEFLTKHGMAVETGIAGMPTAFKAAFEGAGRQKPLIAFLAEYDALPAVGHACGHNIIGASAAGAGAALAALGADLPGAVWVLGTPAEENAGGKIPMAKSGMLEPVDGVFMNHPTTGESRIGGTSLAIHSFRITYKGKPAHASGSPHEGINALDAACIFLHAVGLLRQHVTEDVRLHGIITKGGDATNIIPEHVELRYLARGSKRSELDTVAVKVKRCIEAGALATGCTVEITENRSYEPVKTNTVMSAVLQANFDAVGFDINPEPRHAKGSTDLGEVSQVVPQACANVSIGPATVIGHSQEFAAASASAEGHKALLASAKAMAMAALEVMMKPELVQAAWTEFREKE